MLSQTTPTQVSLVIRVSIRSDWSMPVLPQLFKILKSSLFNHDVFTSFWVPCLYSLIVFCKCHPRIAGSLITCLHHTVLGSPQFPNKLLIIGHFSCVQTSVFMHLNDLNAAKEIHTYLLKHSKNV